MPWKETNMINERTEFALKAIQAGVNFSALCQQYGISRRVGYKWRARFLNEGLGSMGDRSRRPLHSPNQLTEEVLCRMVRLHQAHPSWGPKKIRELYGQSWGQVPSLSSCKRIFEKCGWVKKRRCRAHTETGRIASGKRAEKPNAVWTVDFKGWWHTQDGKRCEPLTVRDEYSRYILEIRAMASAKTEAVRAVFERLFERHGLPEAIRSDNGVPFASAHALLGLSRLSAWWVALGIDLERGRPGKPQDNGAHERMHRDIRQQLQSCAREDLPRQQAAFDLWRNTFNQVRPHEALGMKTPAQLYGPSIRSYQGTPADITYEGMFTRKVHATGTISIDRRSIRLSQALAGWSVGLRPSPSGSYDVFFANLLIGQIDPPVAAFVRASPHEPSSLKTAS